MSYLRRRPDGAAAASELAAEDVWRQPVAVLLTRLATTEAGLDADEAAQRLASCGPNDAAAEKRRPLLLQFLARFGNPLVIILLLASGLSAATGDVPSFVVIAAIVLLSISFDFVQEVRAQNAVAALRAVGRGSGDGAARRRHRVGADRPAGARRHCRTDRAAIWCRPISDCSRAAICTSTRRC